MWQGGRPSVAATDLPRPVAQYLDAQPAVGGQIVRDRAGQYSFANASFIDFYVAQRISDDIVAGSTKGNGSFRTGFCV
jgi:hypothetical protein